MNNKGQTFGITLLSVIFVFIIGFVCVNFLLTEVSTFRVNLNCASPATISDGTKLLCLMVDTTIPYWIYLVFAITVGAVAARIYL